LRSGRLLWLEGIEWVLGAGGKTIHGGCLESWSVREAGRGKGLDMISGSLLL
jgi:hypothetical protein